MKAISLQTLIEPTPETNCIGLLGKYYYWKVLQIGLVYLESITINWKVLLIRTYYLESITERTSAHVQHFDSIST